MTSASKLFHSRRICFDHRNNTVEVPEPDSSPADGNSNRRTTAANRRHHHANNRNNRLDSDGCNPPHRRNYRHRLSEHELIQLEQGFNQSPSGSIINSEDFRSIRRWGATANDRLPGVVLLARERLVERLRGVHVSQNMYSNSPHNNNNNNHLLEEPISSTTIMLPVGLSQHDLNRLSKNVYNNVEERNESSSSSMECSICLEGFEDGDELINLGCMHRFHYCCLFPWVEVCGACPNCRKDIVL